MDSVNMTESSNYHHGNLRQALLQAALTLLDNEGIESVGIRQVAKLVGVAHSAPANHFKNKSALITALNIHIVSHLVDTIKNGLDVNETDLKIVIRSFTKFVLEYGLTYPNRYNVVWRRGYMLPESMEEIYQILVSLLQVYAKRKNIDVETQAIALWSMIHGYVSLRLDGYLDAGKDEITGIDRQIAIIDVIIDGIL
jgi:AcrR family transcriptional regulator